MASILFSLSTKKEEINLHMGTQPIPQVESTVFLGGTIDKRLTWNPHIQAIQEKAIKKLSLMKKLAGTTWGATTKILRQVYIGAVRPIMEYASATWVTASDTTKAKLDKVQNMGLRIILGGMRSTPIRDMEKTAAIQPLELRREYKTLTQGEKSNRLKTHRLHHVLRKEPMTRLKRKSINTITKALQKEHQDILESEPDLCKDLTISNWSRERNRPEIELHVPSLEQKGSQTPEVQKALTLEMIDRKYPHSTWTHVYTDGSSQNAVSNGGSGVFIKLQDRSSHSISVPSGILCSNYRAEMQALTSATDYLITTQEDVGDNLVLLTDSLSALQALMAATSDQLTENLLKNLSSLLQDRRVVLQWIAAHVGVPGNEREDQLAKEGSKQHQTETRMTYRESKTLLKTKLKNQWRDDTDGYQPWKDSIHQLDSNGQDSIYRLPFNLPKYYNLSPVAEMKRRVFIFSSAVHSVK
ncbi:uncharacterized protein LOC135484859 [Lineus longissimus]|uniref:uncharacterized protein LOC135484859 n=1 Tax=Lineus longissimus TaxID=88925 RepID=UPI00315D0E83